MAGPELGRDFFRPVANGRTWSDRKGMRPWCRVSKQPQPGSALDVQPGNYADYDLPSFIFTGSSNLNLKVQSGSAANGCSWTGSRRTTLMAVVISGSPSPTQPRGQIQCGSAIFPRAKPSTSLPLWRKCA